MSLHVSFPTDAELLISNYPRLSKIFTHYHLMQTQLIKDATYFQQRNRTNTDLLNYSMQLNTVC